MTDKRANIRTILADDHPFALHGLKCALLSQSGIHVVGTADSAERLTALLDRVPCDAIVTDYAMSEGLSNDKWALFVNLLNRLPRTPVVCHTAFDAPELVVALARLGVSGIVSKRDASGDIVTAVRSAVAGQQYLSPMAEAARASAAGVRAAEALKTLSRRELEILGLLLSGFPVMAIASMLDRSFKTVSAQKVSIKRRLAAISDPDFLGHAAAEGWVHAFSAR
ncbi:two-component system, NarL family, captular synthesis response regulator RcsB [Cupriavidus sp. YR651]|uniref:response regulator transcription factor n=1 Tax=Cupriavidus sp. YR651 TaxID=1855315 RepID=UPI00088F98DE|nr:response regulator transcription factor [Cupriavidus sp. YR651]SDC97693.1 two-component system, NarL family, captular synthesis response regulator RcsB [Cupriavidus sp. YR651]